MDVIWLRSETPQVFEVLLLVLFSTFAFLLRIRTPVALDIQRPTKSACSAAGVFWPPFHSCELRLWANQRSGGEGGEAVPGFGSESAGVSSRSPVP